MSYNITYTTARMKNNQVTAYTIQLLSNKINKQKQNKTKTKTKQN